jgi:hypothetical protein
MAISVVCESCGQKLSAPDKAAGKRLKCPNCSNFLTVPANLENEAASWLADDSSPTKKPVEDRVKSKLDAPSPAPIPWLSLSDVHDEQNGPGVDVSCPVCKETYSVNPELAGKTIKCRNCHDYIRVSVGETTGCTEESAAEIALPAEEEGVEPTCDNPRLHNCPDCGKEVSRRASQCPNCGCPLQNSPPSESAEPPSREPARKFPFRKLRPQPCKQRRERYEPSSYSWLEYLTLTGFCLGMVGSVAAFVGGIVANVPVQALFFALALFFGSALSTSFMLVILDAARKLRSIDAKLKEQSDRFR